MNYVNMQNNYFYQMPPQNMYMPNMNMPGIEMGVNPMNPMYYQHQMPNPNVMGMYPNIPYGENPQFAPGEENN